MITFINAVIVVAGTPMLLINACAFVWMFLALYAEWRVMDADLDAECSGEGIVWGATAHSMGKP